ncbi:hypothetical protein Cgig2_023145 [Carnegiea gigantea]|uniref:Uncharacterized protein n=1 Tax=Carnegiea gigantea TaxID=171969 RepID=A0A9Q1KCH0_9CARY|nr:hypothetical protein Cgig2_023145 [Carnegiea gigantea]
MCLPRALSLPIGMTRRRGTPHVNGDRRTSGQNQDRSIGFNTQHSHRSSHGGPARSTMASTLYATHFRRIARNKEQEQILRPRGEAFERRRMTLASKPPSARKYYEFHKQNGHTTAKCRELRKAPYELVDKGQIDQFLKKGPQVLRNKRKPARPELRDEECSIEICCKSFFLALKTSFSVFNFSKWRLYLVATSSNLLRSARRSLICPRRRVKMNSIKRCGPSLTSVIATYSSSTVVGQAESVGVRIHDLANFSTKVHLVEALAAKKSARGA